MCLHQVGCLMSSTASGLAGYNIPINGKTADPHTLNAWLRDNGGYTQSNDFEVRSSVFRFYAIGGGSIRARSF